jgi:hypothetical protein
VIKERCLRANTTIPQALIDTRIEREAAFRFEIWITSNPKRSSK